MENSLSSNFDCKKFKKAFYNVCNNHSTNIFHQHFRDLNLYKYTKFDDPNIIKTITNKMETIINFVNKNFINNDQDEITMELYKDFINQAIILNKNYKLLLDDKIDMLVSNIVLYYIYYHFNNNFADFNKKKLNIEKYITNDQFIEFLHDRHKYILFDKECDYKWKIINSLKYNKYIKIFDIFIKSIKSNFYSFNNVQQIKLSVIVNDCLNKLKILSYNNAKIKKLAHDSTDHNYLKNAVTSIHGISPELLIYFILLFYLYFFY